MASFKVSRSHSMPKEEIRATAQGLAEILESKHGVRAQWQGDSVSINSSGVEGQMTFDNDRIDIRVKMNLLASAFEATLKMHIERYLDENLR